MPNCSAPVCKGNYTPEERVPLFQLPEGPPEIRHTWIRTLHWEDIAFLKNIYVCSKHFLKEDIELYHTVAKGYGTTHEVPPWKTKIETWRYSFSTSRLSFLLFLNCISRSKRTRLPLDCKEQDFLNQAINLSLK